MIENKKQLIETRHIFPVLSAHLTLSDKLNKKALALSGKIDVVSISQLKAVEETATFKVFFIS